MINQQFKGDGNLAVAIQRGADSSGAFDILK